jgi:hypothetical protein
MILRKEKEEKTQIDAILKGEKESLNNVRD